MMTVVVWYTALLSAFGGRRSWRAATPGRAVIFVPTLPRSAIHLTLMAVAINVIRG